MKKLKPEVVNVRLVEEPYYITSDKVEIRTANHAIAFFGRDLRTYPAEAVEILYLSTSLRPGYMALVSKGTIDTSLVPLDQIFRIGILSNCSNIIMMHNHPSGNIYPSNTDRLLSSRIEKACEIMHFKLLDNIVVGANNESYYSIKEDEVKPFCEPLEYLRADERDKEPVSLDSIPQLTTIKRTKR